MTPISASLAVGGDTMLDGSALENLKDSLRGDLLLEGDLGYDDARSIWNAMIDRKPALIVRCRGAADVCTAVKFAAMHNLLTSIHGAGHNIAGNAVCDHGLMIDLSEMSEVRVDTTTRRAHVEPGATLGDADHETQAFGLAIPTGINSTTGIAGLTLGGGFGWLSRKYGMTVDALRAADVVTADGNLVHASEIEHPDLFWAIRGGGGNFGVVTRFEFEIFPVGPEVLAGLVVFSHNEAKTVLKNYRKYVAGLGDETSVWAVLRQAPPLPFLPESVHGTNVLVMAICHIGDHKEGEEILKPIRSFGKVLGEHVGVQSFKGWQRAFDPLLTPGARNYWKSHNFLQMEDNLIDIVADYAGKLPSAECEIFFAALGGAVNRVPSDATAYSHRDANFVLNVHGRWENAADDRKCIGWARDFFKASEPYATGGVYINFMTADETERVGAAFGSSYDRLAEVKAKYDPDNLFRMNQNIPPKA
ncbi:MAG: FAD-binding oxidoreductase [candidate division Zixibacteria bacterium]